MRLEKLEKPGFINDPALPTLDQVLAKYLGAVGGKAAQMRPHEPRGYREG
ncbi:MAG TPA: hypothetical protein VJ124_09985 [Pyrinomonadaceae bacterium]|nr:hypothetical protein [Pyrinomonadaceae bacterium]